MKNLRICRIAIALLLLGALLLSGCTGTPAQSDKTEIVCIGFSQYDWTKNILRDTDGANLTLLGGGGTDMHSYQATAKDMVTIATADLLIYTGGTSEAWVREAVAANPNDKRTELALLDLLGENALADEITQGMQHDHDHEDDHTHETALDEHAWLSLRNAQTFVDAIATAITEKDSANADTYRKNAEEYKGRLASLDASYAAAVSDAKSPTLLFADRFPFRYLLHDHGVSYYAAFPGCSAESEASFETVTFLADKVKTLDLPLLLITESGTPALARTIADTAGKSGLQVKVVHAMQSVSAEEIAAGFTYLGAMEGNLAVLSEALG